MAATITATVGGSTSNSYVTLVEADAHFDARLDATDWSGATDDTKNRALIQATQRLDQQRFKGRREDEDQALAFPRVGTFDRDGYAYDSDTIPTPVKRAQMELALAMLGTDLLADTGLEGFKRAKVGPLDVETRYRPAGTLPAHVRREIAHLVEGESALQFDIVRG